MTWDKSDCNMLKLPIIDQTETVLAEHYGFIPEELDFIINYNIKYCMCKELEEGDNNDRHINLHILKCFCSLSRSIITHTEIPLRQVGG